MCERQDPIAQLIIGVCDALQQLSAHSCKLVVWMRGRKVGKLLCLTQVHHCVHLQELFTHTLLLFILAALALVEPRSLSLTASSFTLTPSC